MLLQQSNCALAFDGQHQTFAACHDLSANIGTSYNLLWSVADVGNGSSVLSAAMDVQQDGWAGFGFPASATSGMVGGSAIIVKRDNASATGAAGPLPLACMGLSCADFWEICLHCMCMPRIACISYNARGIAVRQ